uniref:pilus assembly protein n=1 Tax=Sulfuricaulis sp. TaxID=2003553 RepID=UPI003559AB71
TVVIIGMSGIAQTQAKDTDIYLMAPQVQRDDSPNVMIILDNSGSMDTVISSTRPAYDPSINYCTGNLDTLTGISNANAGKPGNCSSISGRIYWSFSSTPPSNSSSDWFTATKNKCLNSTSALNSSGFYGSTKIARWDNTGNNNNKNWKTLNNKDNSTITYVDCMADGTTNGQTAGDNTFPRDSTSVAYTSTANQAFNWTNFTSNATPVLYNANYMNYSNNPNLLVTKTRISVAKDAVKSIIDANKSIRFGLTVFNENNTSPDGGRVIFRIDTMDDTRRTIMKNVVDSLTASTYTPLAETMWEVYRYFGGLTVTYGNPSPVQTPHQDSCAQNVTNSACNNGGKYDAIAAGNSAYNTGTYISPFKFGCQTAYIIYVTDGDPTNDTSADTKIKGLSGIGTCSSPSCLDELSGWMHTHDVYSGLPGNQVVSTYTIGFGGSISASGLALLQQAASKGGGKYYNADDADQLSTALQGAITDILQTNASFTSPSLSINAFNKLFNRDELYFAFFKPSSSVTWDGNIKKFALCNRTQSDAGTCTFGDIIDFNNVPATDIQSKILDTAVSYWATTTTQDGANVTQGGAGSHIAAYNASPTRQVYTYRGSYTGLSASSPASPFVIGTASSNTLRSAAVSNPTILGLASTATSTDVDDLINWMLSKDSYDDWTTASQYVYNKASNTSTADARWAFADPLHSRPAAITYGFESTLLGAPDPNKPIIKLFVGTNDGAVHMINSSTGAEEWAFIPQEMLNQQYSLAQGADGNHITGLDGTPSFWVKDINNDGTIDPAAGDKVYMFIGMRRGGRNIYAFDVTPSPNKVTGPGDTANKVTPKLMWVIQGGSGSYTQLGQTWSRPLVTRVRYACSGSECDDANPKTDDTKSRTVLLFGGGYDTNQDNGIPTGTDSMGHAIYMADPFTGARLWWASSDSSADLVLTNMQYSIPSDLAVNDTNGDGRTDRLYVGDTGGQLWRIDLATNLGTGSNGSTSGFVFADVGCTGDTRMSCSATTKQNRRKFFYPPDVAPVEDSTFSSTALYDLVTIGSGDREDPLDLLTTNLTPVQEAVHNRIYAFRDVNYITGAPATTPSAITETTMFNATVDTLADSTSSGYAAALAAIKAAKGWYIDLQELNNISLPNGLSTNWVGEKVLAKTTIFEGVLYVTTFTPSNDTSATATCAASEGTAKVYALNFLDATPGVDLNGDLVPDRSNTIGGGIPSEVVIVVRSGGTTGLVNVSGGSTQVPLDLSNNPQKSFWHD